MLNFAVYLGRDAIGLDEGLGGPAVHALGGASGGRGSRSSRSAAASNRPPQHVVPEAGGAVRQSFGQLWATLKDLRGYPITLTFLFAYLFFNDGIQTVIASASVYGAEELGFTADGAVATILMVQFVAFGGALLFGRAAGDVGAKRVILVGLVIWMVIVTVALFLPAGERRRCSSSSAPPSASCWAAPRRCPLLLQPADPARPGGGVLQLYHAMERGTTWFGTLIFGLVLR